MLFAEAHARWLLVLHTAVAVAAVGAATHLVVWMWPYLRQRYSRHRAVQRFAGIAFVLHLVAFVLGNMVYPTYRVRVRHEFLDYPSAIAADSNLRADATARTEGRPTELASADEVRARVAAAGKAVRWFDVKEHWLVIGLFASAALAYFLRRWNPSRDGDELALVAVGLALVAALTLWTGAIIGVLTSAWRAV